MFRGATFIATDQTRTVFVGSGGMAASSYFEHRTGLSHLRKDPSSPHTPPRPIASTISSPSVSYRSEEESLVFEFGARHFSAGFAGEPAPRCILGFGPEDSQRVGDYRAQLPGYANKIKKTRRKDWGNEYELWRLDLRDIDLDLVGDKIERAVREAYGRYLLLDYKSAKKVVLVLPSVLPHQLLNKILSSLFLNPTAPPAITLLPAAALATAAAGCRSGLTIDIGWRESVVTAVYEYREVKQWRTIRGMRMVMVEMAKILEEENGSGSQADRLHMSLKEVEQIVSRLGWCRTRTVTDRIIADSLASLPSPLDPRKTITRPFSLFALPVEKVCFLDNHAGHLDDQEQPLHILVYKCLSQLPSDLRAACMTRIIITGGGSNIPGLKSRLLEELTTIVDQRGWDGVYGRVPDAQREKLRRMNLDKKRNNEEPKSSITLEGGPLPHHARPHDVAPFEKDLEGGVKGSRRSMSGVFQGIDTLGAWAGASLLANLRVKGRIEIERDVFLQHGLGGSTKGPSFPKAGERLS